MPAQSILPLFITTYWPPVVQYVLTVTALFFLTAAILFIFIIISRVMDGIKFSRKRLMEKKAQQFITSIMFNDEEWNAIRIENFKDRYLTNTFNCQVFLENLILLRKNIIGEMSDQLRQLYKDLGLHIYSKKKLYSGSWNKIAQGIGELAEMDMQQESVLIRSFINHPNQILRSEAQIAYLKLQNNDPFSFLNELEEHLPEWSQMQLGRAAQKSQALHLPHFENWLAKEEPSIVIFCIRMIAFYNQNQAYPKLINLLDHAAENVRKEAIIALRHLEVFEATEKLISIFEKETQAVKLEILKTLPGISGEENIPFYEMLLSDRDKSLQLAAAKAIVNCSKYGVEIMTSIQNDHNHTLQPIAAYALDKRL